MDDAGNFQDYDYSYFSPMESGLYLISYNVTFGDAQAAPVGAKNCAGASKTFAPRATNWGNGACFGVIVKEAPGGATHVGWCSQLGPIARSYTFLYLWRINDILAQPGR